MNRSIAPRAAKYGLSNDTTWMIGNSPKSDINPALAAGLNAVFVPHGDTWILEHEEIAVPDPPSRLLTVEKLRTIEGTLLARLPARYRGFSAPN